MAQQQGEGGLIFRSSALKNSKLFLNEIHIIQMFQKGRCNKAWQRNTN